MNHRSAPIAAALLGLATAYPWSAFAQSAENNRDANVASIVISGSRDPLATETETGSRLGLTALELPATVATVDGEVIRARGDLTVVDAVTRAPGFTTAADGGNGGTALAARGFVGQGSVLQLVDGVRLFPTAGTISFPTDPWNVERIEVLSGPASVLYGQGALGGAINVITKKPTERQTFDVETSYGSQNTYHVAAGAGDALTQRLSYRVDGSYRRSDGWIDRSENDSLALGGALGFEVSERLSLTLRADYGKSNPMPYFGTPLINGRLDQGTQFKNYNARDADVHYRDDRLTLTADWEISDNVRLSNSAYRLSNKRVWYTLDSFCWIAPDDDGDGTGECRNGFGSGTPGTVLRSSNLGIIHDTTQYGDQGSVTIASPLGGSVRNDLVVGFDINRVNLDYSHNFDFAFQADELDPFNFQQGALESMADTIPRYLTRTDEWSVFVEDRLKLTDQWSVVGGFRHEEDKVRRRNFTYDASGNRTGTVNAFPLGFNERKLDNFTWRVGTVFQPVPSISIYGQYSTGVDPLGTLTTYTTNASQFLFTNAKGEQIEAGLKTRFLDGRGSATLAAYRIVKNGLVAQRSPTSPVEQIGQQSSRGVEASITLALPGRFSIDANGTILEAKYDDFINGGTDYSGNTAPNVPEEAANLWLTWEGLRDVRIQAGLRYVGRRYSDSANQFRIPSFTVVDAGVSRAITSNIAAELRIYNLFDQDRVDTAYYDEQWVLGRPRSVDFAVRARF